MSLPNNIIPLGEFSSFIVKKCEQNGVLVFSIRLSENSDNYVNECKESGIGGTILPSSQDVRRTVAKIR